MSRLETPLFLKALLQGYIYFRDNDKNIHKGYIVKYVVDIAYFTEHLEVAYGVHYYFNHLVDGKYELWLDDCDEEFIKDPHKHELAKEAYTCGLTIEDYHLDFEHYGEVWALSEEDLL